MSREEAIKELTDLLPEEFLSEYTDAIKMAIEALEKEPCGDAISKQSVLDIMQMRIGGKELYKAVYDLPPVTPQPKMGRWIKCIDDNGSSYHLCSACRCGEDFMFDWCPNCGSKNGGGDNGNE